jgi:hypothetical protein
MVYSIAEDNAMLREEFLAAWKEEYESPKGIRPWGLVERPDVHFVEFAMAHYHRSELDHLLTGPNRHRKFVEWCFANYGELSRIADREYHAMLSKLIHMAEDRPIKG